MLRRFAREVLWPPPFAEALSPAQWRQLARVRLVLAAFAVGIDVALLLLLRGDAAIDRAVLERFAAINIPVLLLGAAISVGMLRSRALQSQGVLAVAAALDAFTIIVWAQATGTLTSYFIFAGALILTFYRLYTSWLAGAAVMATLLFCHGGAIALEIAGVLRPEPLLVGAPGRVYTVPAYQAMAASSIAWIYLLVFVACNAFVNRLRAADRAVAELRREAARAAERLAHGRLTGTVLAGEYALGELLGRGGMGEIYAARRISDEEPRAVKVLHSHLVDDEQHLERFRREGGVAARVPAEHTARVHEVGHDDERDLHFIAMDYLRGEDMAAYLRRRGPLALDDFLPLVRRVAVALDAAHAAGVVHRDLKPQNVFLVSVPGGGPPEVKLLDFGMSKLADGATHTLTRTEMIIGTVGYLAPEQALGRASEAGPAADRFAFAALCYKALTGRAPFEGGDLVSALRRVAQDRQTPPSTLRPDLPADFDVVMTIGLAKAPGDRYPSAIAMVDDLSAAVAGTLDDATWLKSRRLDGAVGQAETLAATPTATATATRDRGGSD